METTETRIITATRLNHELSIRYTSQCYTEDTVNPELQLAITFIIDSFVNYFRD